jgi:hypothetical protein
MKKASALICFLLIFGCSKKEIKDSADIQEVQALTGLLSELRHSYEQGDATALFKHFSPSYLEVAPLRLKVETDLKRYPERHLSFTPQRIWIRGGEASVTLRWEGEWVRPPSQPPLRQSGTALFRLVKSGDGRFQLAEIRGENPFTSQS